MSVFIIVLLLLAAFSLPVFLAFEVRLCPPRIQQCKVTVLCVLLDHVECFSVLCDLLYMQLINRDINVIAAYIYQLLSCYVFTRESIAPLALML